MRTHILFAAIFLVCGVFSADVNNGSQEKAPVDNTNVNTKEVQPQEPSQKEVPVVGKKEVLVVGKKQVQEHPVKSNDSTNTKATDAPVKPEIKVKQPSSHPDVSDLIGENVFSRAAYLLTGISVLVLLYFAWRSFSLRRRQTHIHKYGVVASREDLEMTALGFGSEDEDDDTTHFDIGKHQRS